MPIERQLKEAKDLSLKYSIHTRKYSGKGRLIRTNKYAKITHVSETSTKDVRQEWYKYSIHIRVYGTTAFRNKGH